jgi:integrase
VYKVGTKSEKSAAVKRFTATWLDTCPPGKYKDPAQQSLYFLVRRKREGQFSRTWLHRTKRRQYDRTLKKDVDNDSDLVIGHFPETSLHEARKLIQERRELIGKGIDPQSAAPRRRRARTSDLTTTAFPAAAKHTMEFLTHEFVEKHVRPNRKRPDYVERILTRDVLTETPGWQGRDARTIKPREVIELLDGIVARGSKVMANRTAGILDQMFKFGLHRAIVETNPVQLLYRPGGKESARDRCLTDDELRVLLGDPKEATRFERLAHVIVILLLTGQRRGELALARWVDIDFDHRTWRIPDGHSKTGKGHTVPLSSMTVTEFEALQRLAKHNRFVLPNDAGDGPIDPKLLTRGVARCLPRMKGLGIEAFTLHDLRRTCRTGLARLKVQPHIAERVLNHAQEKIVGTYDTHDYLDEKREALDSWGNYLRNLTHAPP